MEIDELWDKALKNTEIIRSRVQELQTYSDTQVPYVLLSKSTVNLGDTVVRKGQVTVQKPTLILPNHNPQFNGFEVNGANVVNENSFINFLLVRGISLPSLSYDNKTVSLEVFDGELSNAVNHYNDLLQKQENVKSGLITAPEECWPFSLLIFICAQIVRNADQDINKILEKYRKNGPIK